RGSWRLLRAPLERPLQLHSELNFRPRIRFEHTRLTALRSLSFPFAAVSSYFSHSRFTPDVSGHVAPYFSRHTASSQLSRRSFSCMSITSCGRLRRIPACDWSSVCALSSASLHHLLS